MNINLASYLVIILFLFYRNFLFSKLQSIILATFQRLLHTLYWRIKFYHLCRLEKLDLLLFINLFHWKWNKNMYFWVTKNLSDLLDGSNNYIYVRESLFKLVNVSCLIYFKMHIHHKWIPLHFLGIRKQINIWCQSLNINYLTDVSLWYSGWK